PTITIITLPRSPSTLYVPLFFFAYSVHHRDLHSFPTRRSSDLENATVIIKRSLGTPARALKNRWTDAILELEEKQAGYETLKDYISGEANKRYIHEGKAEEGFGWSGQGAARIHHIPSVKELIDSIIEEGEQIRKQWNITR